VEEVNGKGAAVSGWRRKDDNIIIITLFSAAVEYILNN
jgi:hypothetical protein